jgi:hypothetical protein
MTDAIKLPELDRIASGVVPTIYFDSIPAYGHAFGVIRMTLEVCRTHTDSAGGVFLTRAEVADLRMPVEVARMTRDTLDKAILFATQALTEAKN